MIDENTHSDGTTASVKPFFQFHLSTAVVALLTIGVLMETWLSDSEFFASLPYVVILDILVVLSAIVIVERIHEDKFLFSTPALNLPPVDKEGISS